MSGHEVDPALEILLGQYDHHRQPRWPWGIGLDKRQARRLRRRLAREAKR